MIEDLRFKNHKSKIVNPNFTPDISKIIGKLLMSNPYPQHKKPELLSPAGDMECFFAAVENGADAVYFGLKDFSARASADNFAIDDASKAIVYARKRSVKVYIAINTLIKTQELESVVDYLIALDELQPDALIIQDLGLLYLIRSQFPHFQLHASTQMTIHNLAGVKRLERMGFKRVVLSRELSIDEIKNISRNTSMEIEVFVHGALCYSYSGLCFFSSMMGGRSGNRGRCAQPCRMYYKSQPDEGGYLFSMKDLRTLSYIKELMTAGIHSFKIEGRMKSPEYVAVVTHTYRQAIDGKLKDEEAAIHLMNTVFSREAACSYLIKEKGQRNSKTADIGAVKPSDMINPSYPANIGSYAGEVKKSGKGYVTIRADAEIGVRDLLQVFENSSEEPALLHVKNIKIDGKRVFDIKAGDIAIVDTERQYRLGARLYLLSSQKVKEMFAPKVPKKLEASKIPIDVAIKIRPDSIGIKGTAKHFSFSRDYPVKLEKGIHRTTDAENIKECFARLGETPFELTGIHTEFSGELFVPLSVLNEIRREYFQIFCEEWRKDRNFKSENIKKWVQEKCIEYRRSDSQLPGESSISTSINPPLEKGVTVYPHLNFPTSPFLPLSDGDRVRKLRDNEYSPPLVGGVRGGGELLQKGEWEDLKRDSGGIIDSVENKEGCALNNISGDRIRLSLKVDKLPYLNHIPLEKIYKIYIVLTDESIRNLTKKTESIPSLWDRPKSHYNVIAKEERLKQSPDYQAFHKKIASLPLAMTVKSELFNQPNSGGGNLSSDETVPHVQKNNEAINKLSNVRDRVVFSLPPIMRDTGNGCMTYGYFKKVVQELISQDFRQFQISNLGALELFEDADVQLYADYPFYCLNPLSAMKLRELGFCRHTLSPEDGKENLQTLFALDTDVIVYQDTPLFTSETCMWANMKGKCPGRDRCGFRRIIVENEYGDRFLALDEACKTVVIGERPFSITHLIPNLIESGQRDFRIDLCYKDYTPEMIEEICTSIQNKRKTKNSLVGNFERGLL